MWTYYNPVEIEFGVGSFDGLAKHFGGRCYGLVTYPDTFCTDLTARLADSAGPARIVINDVTANPDYAVLGAQTRRIADTGRPEVWVALGGGSVIDSAKVFAAAAADLPTLRNFLKPGRVRKPIPPHRSSPCQRQRERDPR